MPDIMRYTTLLSALIASPTFASDKPAPAAVEHFEKSVRPLLIEKCGKCHIEKSKGGLKLDSRANLFKGGDLGPAVVPGDAVQSRLFKTLQYDGELKMPPAGKLAQAEIDAVQKWLNDGAVWPTTETTVTKPDGDQLFTPEEKAFWAFEPVKSPPVPKNTSVHPVDAFVLEKLNARGLKASPPADKRTLLRRVYFDLIGLPPTFDEVQAFEADTSPNAFENVIDKLLASPHYGERWGRHWLDVARYADSNGMDENTLFGNAWRYRDYVVNSFNADKPYDEFLREQIAGDLLPPTNDEQVMRERSAALGYLALGPKLLAEPDKQKMLLDIADEQLDTMGKSILGLTFGCARCHDHKFDPIPTRDYYSLLAIFTSTRTMQDLNTVAKTFERSHGEPENVEVTKAKAELDKVRNELRELEKQFGKTPESDKPKRREIHLKAEEKRATIKNLEARIPADEMFLGVEEGSVSAYGTAPRNLHVQIRGNYSTPGEEAPAVFPRVIAGESQTPFVLEMPNRADKPEPNKTRFGAIREQSGRLQLANWLTAPSNPLTARVMANRVWLHHFGEGLVRTPDNFGRLGERPTHPELLDWLAAEFVRKGWSIKKLHKLILLTSTYQQACGTPPEQDPANRLLSTFPRRRLDAETLRDSLLCVSGNLDYTVGGSIHSGNNLDYVREVKYETHRRSIYLPVIRGKLFPFFVSFDFPDPGVTVGKRDTTTVPAQALYLLNNPFVESQARSITEQVLRSPTTRCRIEKVYRITLQRDPNDEEVTMMSTFVAAYSSKLSESEFDPDAVQHSTWCAAIRGVMSSTEYLTIE